MRSRARLRPVLWIVWAVVLYSGITAQPHPGTAGVHLGVAVALLGVCLSIGLTAIDVWPMARSMPRVGFAVLAGASGLLLQALQPSYAALMPVAVGVLAAVLFLPLWLGGPIAGVLTGGVLVEAWLVPGGSPAVAASELSFCAVLAVMALSMRRAGQNQERAEVLLARLEDAGDAEARAAVLAERTRIARDLHDVLAQSLSGLAIQLEGARRLGRREEVSEQLQTVIERAGGLVKEGLEDARRAVVALRDTSGQALDRLPDLVERYRADHRLEACFRVEGEPRELPPEAGLALYRGAQEALTNAARYAHGSRTTVTLRFDAARVVLSVVDQGPGPSAQAAGSGPGMGLIGMRERLAQVGGTALAGPLDQGWSVRMEVAA
ncbi:sensor histidine kinase [Streptacidiphilus albus]|uniref:sensor histidine kinase n=1 Tax=Streptacidiphilus albus TaxID=105425 RepID=UPI000A8998FD|nr:sensor histidine kinase [Streptacidiphilus albus]